MILQKNCGHYFDGLKIYSTQDPEILKNKLPVSLLKRECSVLNIRHSAKIKYKRPVLRSYRHDRRTHLEEYCHSLIEVTAPTQRFLELLSQNESLLGGCMLTYVELAYDEFTDNESAAILETMKMFSTIRKKYSYGRTFFCSDNKKSRERMLKDRRKGLFGEETWYSRHFVKGSPDKAYLKYVIYPRYTKINFDPNDMNTWIPCVHYEWRIKGWKFVQTLTGISGITSLVNFDFRKFFKTMAKQYITHEKLNHDAIAVWMSDYKGRHRIDTLPLRTKFEVELPAVLLLECENIRTYSDFRNYITREKKRIKEKRGFRTAWEKEIMRLKNLSRFAVPQ